MPSIDSTQWVGSLRKILFNHVCLWQQREVRNRIETHGFGGSIFTGVLKIGSIIITDQRT